MRIHGRVAILVSLLTLVLASPVSAQVTGTWVGTTETTVVYCTPDVYTHGTARLVLAQNGTSFSGTMAGESPNDVNTCRLLTTPADPFTLALSGTVNGSSFSGRVTHEGKDVGSIAGSVNGSAMTFTITIPTDKSQPEWKPEHGDIDSIINGTVTRTNAPDPPAIISFVASPTATTGGAATLSWVTRNATAVSINSGVTTTLLSGSVTVAPNVTTTYTLTATGPGGPAVTAQATISVTLITPAVTSFTATPPAITVGEASVLAWTTTNATAVTVTGLTGTFPGASSATVRPTATTTYRLTATGPGGTATASVTITVTSPATPAEVVVSAYPRGLIRASSDTTLSTDSYTLTNVGGTTTRLTLTQSGTFFTQRPTLFDLLPGSSQTIFITASGTGEPVASGSSIVSGTGANLQVPIRMLVAATPIAPVAVTAPEPRADFVAPAGQNPSGQINFTNSSNQAIQGLLTVDSEWISVPPAVITIGGGGTAEVQVSIDRSRRPDAAAPIGGVIGSVTFSYVNAIVTPAPERFGPVTHAVTPVITKVTVVIVDVVALNTSAGIPPLAAGQLGFFIPGATSSLTVGDLVLSNLSSTTISDMAILFSPVGGSPGNAVALGQFKAGTGIVFPGVVKNIFNNSPSMTGTLHVRSSDLSKISIAQTQVDTKRGLGYALPVMRSDDGFDAGQALFLPGVQSSSNLSTSLYLQEMAGKAATVAVDYLDAAGAVVVSPNSPVSFNSQTLMQLNVPAGAVTARVTNNSTTGARINGHVLVTDRTTNDAYTIVQVGPITDPMVAPAFSAEAGEMVLHLVNSSAAPISVTATTVSSGPRRRGVKRSSVGSDAAQQQPPPITLPPFGSTQVRVATSGFVRVTGSNAVRVAGRFSTSGIGSGVAALPASRSAAKKTFAGVEDSAPDATRKLSYTTNLMLVETTGNDTTVKLTLHYNFTSGKVSSSRSTAETFLVPANGFALIDDLAAAIIGISRASYGDLHNATLDIEVTDGNGSVLSFLQVIDNGSGDVTVRHD